MTMKCTPPTQCNEDYGQVKIWNIVMQDLIKILNCTMYTALNKYSQLSISRSFGDFFLQVQITRSAN